MSKQQELLLEKIQYLLGDNTDMISNFRPEWMRNPKTNKNLEIDIYIPQFKLGIEFQGNQHFFPVPKMYMNPDAVRYGDTIKAELAWNRKRVRIVEFFPDDLLADSFKGIFLIRTTVLSKKYYSSLNKHIANTRSMRIQKETDAVKSLMRERFDIDYRYM